MTDSVSTASTFGSSVADRVSAWLIDHPEATEYCVNDEREAMQILTEILAHLMLMKRDIPDAVDRRKVRDLCKQIRKAIVQARAIEWIRQKNKTDPIEYLGVKLTVPALVIN